MSREAHRDSTGADCRRSWQDALAPPGYGQCWLARSGVRALCRSGGRLDIRENTGVTVRRRRIRDGSGCDEWAFTAVDAVEMMIQRPRPLRSVAAHR
jgi:hypothetical protein